MTAGPPATQARSGGSGGASSPAGSGGTGGAAGTTLEGTWDTAWAAALEALELDTDRAEQLLRDRAWDTMPASMLAPFTPPDGLGPLPLTLADRARRLLERQLHVAGELVTAMHANRQHAALAARMSYARADSRPVFVDRTD